MSICSQALISSNKRIIFEITRTVLVARHLWSRVSLAISPWAIIIKNGSWIGRVYQSFCTYLKENTPGWSKAVWEAMLKNDMFAGINLLYRNRYRLFHKNRAEDPLYVNQVWPIQTATKWGQVWLWQKLIELMSDHGPAPALSNVEIINLVITYQHSQFYGAWLISSAQCSAASLDSCDSFLLAAAGRGRIACFWRWPQSC